MRVDDITGTGITIVEEDQTEYELDESRMTWARKGSRIVRKFRCMGGPRKGRTVAEPSQCFAAPDVKKRLTLQRTKAAKGRRMAKKARRTKRTNPASKISTSLNRRK